MPGSFAAELLVLGGSLAVDGANASSSPCLAALPCFCQAVAVAAWVIVAVDEAVHCALAGLAGRVPLLAVCGASRHLCRCASTLRVSWSAAGPCLVRSTGYHTLGGRCRRVAALGSRRL